MRRRIYSSGVGTNWDAVALVVLARTVLQLLNADIVVLVQKS